MSLGEVRSAIAQWDSTYTGSARVQTFAHRVLRPRLNWGIHSAAIQYLLPSFPELRTVPVVVVAHPATREEDRPRPTILAVRAGVRGQSVRTSVVG